MGDVIFPDPRQAQEDGLLCVGGRLEMPYLLAAYAQGIFPWPQEGLPILWFSPAERGILEFSELHVPRRYARQRRKLNYQITFNREFAQVIKACAAIGRAGQRGTWITAEMVEAYENLHRHGFAHSVEVWREGELVGGLYGVYIAGVFSGESMFYRASHASKEALLALIEVLKKNGIEWMDTQMVTPVIAQMGGRTIPRTHYLQWLQDKKGPHQLVW